MFFLFCHVPHALSFIPTPYRPYRHLSVRSRVYEYSEQYFENEFHSTFSIKDGKTIARNLQIELRAKSSDISLTIAILELSKNDNIFSFFFTARSHAVCWDMGKNHLFRDFTRISTFLFLFLRTSSFRPDALVATIQFKWIVVNMNNSQDRNGATKQSVIVHFEFEFRFCVQFSIKCFLLFSVYWTCEWILTNCIWIDSVSVVRLVNQFI